MANNSNRFIINSPNWGIEATNANGDIASVGNEVFVASSFDVFKTTFEDAITAAGAGSPTVSLAGNYYARKPNGDWSAYTPSSYNGTCTVNGGGGSISGSMRLADGPNNWIPDTTNFSAADRPGFCDQAIKKSFGRVNPFDTDPVIGSIASYSKR